MRSLVRLSRAVALAGALAAVSSFGSLPASSPPPLDTPRIAATPIDLDDHLAAFYRDRGFRPLWATGGALRPHGERLLAILAREGRLDSDLKTALTAGIDGDRRALARADLLLTDAFADLATDLHRTPAETSMRYVDPELTPQPASVRTLLERIAAARSPAEALDSALRVNPALDGLRRGLADYRARWSRLPQVDIPSGPTLEPGSSGVRVRRLRRRLGLGDGEFDATLAATLRDFQATHGLASSGTADAATLAALNAGAAHYERLILGNIERARAIPAHSGGRYILVDAAAARLWLVEDGRFTGSMRVVVGKRDMQTPAMAGLIRFAVLNPYWNLPPDLIRDRARKVLRRGPKAMAAERLQILSDWSRSARVLKPSEVDWPAVAAGRRYVNLRQRPGPHNMMGAIKFMMPNDLGIYLHDTPFREHFARDDRRISSGCVRLEDAQRLARWLFGGRAPGASGAAEQRVELPEPVPVYITYLTAVPSRGRIRFQPDRYGRDRAMLAQLARRNESR
ncbi:L,D-transpeptidase family protein [Sphingosinicella sp. CPCC 101087]|uniref:L,D-transpeptidase family protein n=1 Tax=Sphingosinicella sp. CPCC 101087 TaxID=2497754 RepID=UPI00101E1F31|nr:L,D-transpeptidase family protein [Sphingosinicella sp. CPCC 101087]